MRWMRGVVLYSLMAVPAIAQVPAPPAPLLNLDFKAELQADGTLANIEPDATLTPALQAMLRKRVAEWRYQVATWHGAPVLSVMHVRIVAEPVPVKTGGYALRIKELTGAPRQLTPEEAADQSRKGPPEYPLEARRRGITGTLVYAMRLDAQGKATEVELVSPRRPDHWFKMFDASGRAAIAGWVMPPVKINGQPVDCRFLVPLEFMLDNQRNPPAPKWELDTYRNTHADMCPPAATLLNKVEGTLL